MSRMRVTMKARPFVSVMSPDNSTLYMGHVATNVAGIYQHPDFGGADRRESGGICSEGDTEESNGLPEQGTVYHTDLADG